MQCTVYKRVVYFYHVYVLNNLFFFRRLYCTSLEHSYTHGVTDVATVFVCLSVHMSITRWYCVKTTEPTMKQSTLRSYIGNVVVWRQSICWNFKWGSFSM